MQFVRGCIEWQAPKTACEAFAGCDVHHGIDGRLGPFSSDHGGISPLERCRSPCACRCPRSTHRDTGLLLPSPRIHRFAQVCPTDAEPPAWGSRYVCCYTDGKPLTNAFSRYLANEENSTKPKSVAIWPVRPGGVGGPASCCHTATSFMKNRRAITTSRPFELLVCHTARQQQWL